MHSSMVHKIHANSTLKTLHVASHFHVCISAHSARHIHSFVYNLHIKVSSVFLYVFFGVLIPNHYNLIQSVSNSGAALEGSSKLAMSPKIL